MSWFNTEGKDPHHVIRSETRYIRNFKDKNFIYSASADFIEEMFSLLHLKLEENGFSKENSDSLLHYGSLLEKGFTDKDFFDYQAKYYSSLQLSDEAKSGEKRKISGALYFNEPCSLIIQLGGGDYLTIRSSLAGRAISESQSIALEAEATFDRHFSFAYDANFGYLSQTPNNCGSGEMFSVLLFLPALRLSGEIEKIFEFCRCHGAYMLPLFEYKNSDYFTLFYSPSHTSDRISAAAGFDILIERISEQEKENERILFAESGKIIIDRAFRAYGILTNAKQINENEFLSFISDIRLSLSASGDVSICPPISIGALNFLLAEGLNYSVADYAGSFTSDALLDEKRAELVLKIINSDKN